MQSRDAQTSSPAPANVDFVFHDRGWARFSRGRRNAHVIIIPLLFFLVVLALALPQIGVPAIVVLVCVLFFLGWRDRERRIAQLDQLIRDGDRNLWWGVNAGVRTWLNGDCESFVREAARSAWRRDHRGKVVCIADEGSVAEVTPLEIPFEPLPLNLHEPRFVEYYRMAVRADRFDKLDRRVRPRSEFGHLRRFLETNQWLLGVAIIGILLASEALRRGGFARPNVLVTAALFMQLLALLLRLNARKTVLVVPRGVVIRRIVRGKGKYSLAAANDSLLVVAREHGKFWRVAIGGESDVIEFRCERCEVELLLAAWLSPLDAPTEEIIAGLT